MQHPKSRPNTDPIHDAPLRDPGQSLRDQLDDLFVDTVAPWLTVAVFAIVLAILEWCRWWFGLPPAPIAATTVALAVSALASKKYTSAKRIAVDLRTGLKGERTTGQLLQVELLPLGYQVFHDCCFDRFNVDHVAIGPGGVFAIETKTRLKPHGNAKVSYDGRGILVNGHVPDRDPIAQANAGADRIRDVLAEFSGSQVAVRPVVLFPGWFVEKQPRGANTWVLNPKAFAKFVSNEPVKLAPEQVRLLSAALARYIRTTLA